MFPAFAAKIAAHATRNSTMEMLITDVTYERTSRLLTIFLLLLVILIVLAVKDNQKKLLPL